jgi:hypothetical protein
MADSKSWFEVDREGLAKILGRRGKEFLVYELVSNAWDSNAKKVEITLEPVPGRPQALLVVSDDDPEGFRELSHAWTLFAESGKKADAEKRGRFNLGEKLVLALCEDAKISITTGTVRFMKEGRSESRSKREQGSQFEAVVRMTREEFEDVERAVWKLLPPENVRTFLNGKEIPRRPVEKTVQAALPTEIADPEGVLRRTVRKTSVEIVSSILPGEAAFLYEMGVPVVELSGGEKHHLNVLQKVPLNSDRDNVTPAYLRDLRTILLNETHRDLRPEEAAEPWVREASADEKASKEAVLSVMSLRFGEKRVIADPSDPEGTKIAASQGYSVIPPRALSAREWENVRKFEAAKPAGQVTPSPKPYSPSGDPLEELQKEKWTPGIQRVAEYAKMLSGQILGRPLEVRVVNKATWPYNATYTPGQLVLNLGRLGRAWFDREIGEEVDELLLHEFAHGEPGGGDHLSEEYHRGLCRLGARLVSLALRKPNILKSFGRICESPLG